MSTPADTPPPNDMEAQGRDQKKYKHTGLYDLLDVDPSANADQLKKAYRRTALKLHPDKPGGDTDKFTEMLAAYTVLTNPKHRYVFGMV